MTVTPAAHETPQKVLLRCFSEARLSTYLDHCGGELDPALTFYEWNTAISGAAWEVLIHVEVALRNALAAAMQRRHDRHRRAGSWLDDPAGELDAAAGRDIDHARRRVWRSGHRPSDGQTIAQLGLGFWRFLIVRRYNTTLWPDLAGAFPHAPDRARSTVEEPTERLHGFRNRVAHHERLWAQPLADRYADMLTLLGFIDPVLARWVANDARFPAVLAARPVMRPGRMVRQHALPVSGGPGDLVADPAG